MFPQAIFVERRQGDAAALEQGVRGYSDMVIVYQAKDQKDAFAMEGVSKLQFGRCQLRGALTMSSQQVAAAAPLTKCTSL
ncbi:MAG: hypothetical protein H0V56_04035 [Chthoniobacterales bacterium]|nr:hypothetical protein [Chthoniobacterales bacterium]